MQNNVFLRNNDKYNPDINDKLNKLKLNRNSNIILGEQKPYKPIIYDKQPVKIRTVKDMQIQIDKGDPKLINSTYEYLLNQREKEKTIIQQNIDNTKKIINNQPVQQNNTSANSFIELKKSVPVTTPKNILDDELNNIINDVDKLINKYK